MSIGDPSAGAASSQRRGRRGADRPPAGRPDPGRLVAQRGFFAAPFDRVPDDLYCTIEQGRAVRQRHRVALEPFSQVSTNAYFGRFPASYWQRWTSATQVRLDAEVSGAGVASLVASDRFGCPRVVATADVDGAQRRVTLLAAIDRFVDGGALWLEITSRDAALTVQQVHWSVTAPARLRPTAVVICTFNRAEDCLHTLEVLGGDEGALQLVDAVYVVDQGTDTVESQPGFARVRDMLGAKLRYRRQPNLGGAGGFTRGLYEVAEVQHADHANVLFMDDDILLEPDTVVRLTAFANRATEPVLVGAQMLYLLHPNLVYSWAQRADLGALRAGRPVPDGLVRIDLLQRRQDVRVDAGYNAWWSCLIPSEAVARAGYPLPMFFQWDDIEYGYRARAGGYATVTLPGAGVWHADFDWKDADEPTAYFAQRNELITSALHSDFDPKLTTRIVRDRLLRYLVSMRYGLAATAIKAVEDFLEGPQCLHDGGVEAMAAVRKLRAEYPETQRHPASEVPGVPSGAMPMAPLPPRPSRPRAVMAKRLLWQLLRKPQATVALSERDARWWHVSRFRTAVVTDGSQQGIRVRRLDRDQLVTLGRRAARVLRRLRREGRGAQQRYKAAMPELTSRENWQRLFERQ